MTATPGYSGMQRLVLKCGPRTLRCIGAILVIAATQPTAALAENRKVADGEMKALLEGCWFRMAGPLEEIVCFERDGRLTEQVTGGPDNLEAGAVFNGAYRVTGGKLRFNNMNGSGSVTGQRRMICDVLMRPQESIRLMNCVRSETGERVPESPWTSMPGQIGYLRLPELVPE